MKHEYSWHRASDLLHLYMRTWQEQTLDGMAKDHGEPLAFVQQLPGDGKNWRVMVNDQFGKPIELDQGKFYDNLVLAQTVVENHDFGYPK